MDEEDLREEALGRSRSNVGRVHSVSRSPTRQCSRGIITAQGGGGTLRKSQSLNQGPIAPPRKPAPAATSTASAEKAKPKTAKNGLPETALDIHKLIFESDERIKEMLYETNRERRSVSSEKNIFECNHCGSENVVKNKNKKKNNNKRSDNGDGLDENQNYGGKRHRSGGKRDFFRSKSKARFLNSEEQIKLSHFRRFLRGADVGYHDLIEKVEEIRKRQKEEKRKAVDEDGFRAKGKEKKR